MSDLVLSDSVNHLKGVGEERAKTLASMRLETIADLLFYFPFRYDHYEIKDLEMLEHQEKATIVGKVHSQPSLAFYRRRRSRLTVRVLVGRHLIKAIWFNQSYVKKKIAPGDVVTVTGKWDMHRQEMVVERWLKGEQKDQDAIVPVYSVKENISVNFLRKLIKSTYQQYQQQIAEILPGRYLQQYKLLGRRETIRALHFPGDFRELQQARRRYVYEELLLFQLKMQMFKKIRRTHTDGIQHIFAQEKITAYIEGLPFPLTDAQHSVLQEILQDMRKPERMNRLLQGDVGSGKTVVAVLALYANAVSGYQGALMVPTEILAEQHFQSIAEFLAPYGINVQLLTSSVKGKGRKALLAGLQTGDIDVVIGTHALIQDEVIFSALGLAVTDEQHRFGVKQRRVLTDKGLSPDILYMTATPIPRTLAISLFGDMDVSTIDEMPKGRLPIETYWAKPEMFERVLAFMDQELQQGRQAYVVCPLIEESEELDVQNAIALHDQLQDYFSSFHVGLLHGRMSAADKEEVMQQYLANQYQVLVSTTVIEVGVDVANATVMMIYDAERFGLSQLHQLRGRVGRGNEQAYCLLIADPKTEQGKQRMRIMTDTTDGFVLSEEDLKLRGSGDFFGHRQSGMPEFRLADLTYDYRTLETARQDAAVLIDSQTFWEDDEYDCLRRQLQQSGALSLETMD